MIDPAESTPGAESSPGVGLISPAGWGNLGDAAILDSLIRAIRLRRPTAPIVGFTQRPADTRVRHQIPAFTLSGFARPLYGMEPDAPTTAQDNVPTTPSRSRRSRLVKVPGVSEAITVAGLIAADRRHRAELRPVLESLGSVVVAGGGQFDDLWGGPLGHPYVLSRWARQATSIGAEFDILSVGAGLISGRQTRWFLEDALRHADYASFRDATSKSMLGAAATNSSVVPDLVFGLPDAAEPEPPAARRVIGFSPIALGDPRSWPRPDPEQYADYLDRAVRLAELLVEAGFSLVMFSTSPADDDSAQEIVGRLGPAQRRGHVRTAACPTHEQVLEALGEVHLVVASRLHSVLLGHLAHRPVVALSYERKVDAAMAEMGHSGYCLSAQTFDPSTAADTIRAAFDRREELRVHVVRQVSVNRERVEAQYSEVFGPPRDSERSSSRVRISR